MSQKQNRAAEILSISNLPHPIADNPQIWAEFVTDLLQRNPDDDNYAQDLFVEIDDIALISHLVRDGVFEYLDKDLFHNLLHRHWNKADYFFADSRDGTFARRKQPLILLFWAHENLHKFIPDNIHDDMDEKSIMDPRNLGLNISYGFFNFCYNFKCLRYMPPKILKAHIVDFARTVFVSNEQKTALVESLNQMLDREHHIILNPAFWVDDITRLEAMRQNAKSHVSSNSARYLIDRGLDNLDKLIAQAKFMHKLRLLRTPSP